MKMIYGAIVLINAQSTSIIRSKESLYILYVIAWHVINKIIYSKHPLMPILGLDIK